jgi:hypothetical protein
MNEAPNRLELDDRDSVILPDFTGSHLIFAAKPLFRDASPCRKSQEFGRPKQAQPIGVMFLGLSGRAIFSILRTDGGKPVDALTDWKS